jgi:hypothetical protein
MHFQSLRWRIEDGEEPLPPPSGYIAAWSEGATFRRITLRPPRVSTCPLMTVIKFLHVAIKNDDPTFPSLPSKSYVARSAGVPVWCPICRSRHGSSNYSIRLVLLPVVYGPPGVAQKHAAP